MAQTGTVYTETIIYSAPEQFVHDAPYQLAIISLDSGGRRTGRIRGERVHIGDKVTLTEVDPAGISWFEGVSA